MSFKVIRFLNDNLDLLRFQLNIVKSTFLVNSFPSILYKHKKLANVKSCCLIFYDEFLEFMQKVDLEIL